MNLLIEVMPTIVCVLQFEKLHGCARVRKRTACSLQCLIDLRSVAVHGGLGAVREIQIAENVVSFLSRSNLNRYINKSPLCC
jgi:hypothetical protein